MQGVCLKTEKSGGRVIAATGGFFLPEYRTIGRFDTAFAEETGHAGGARQPSPVPFNTKESGERNAGTFKNVNVSISPKTKNI